MKKIKNLKISRRMTFAFGIVIALMLAVAALSMQMLSSLNQDLNEVTKGLYVKVRLVSKISEELSLQGQLSRDALILTGEQAQAELNKIYASREKVKAVIEILSSNVRSEEGKRLRAIVLERRAAYAKEMDEFIRLVKSGNEDEAAQLLRSVVRDRQAAYSDALGNLTTYQESLMNTASEKADALAKAGIREILGLSVLAIVLAAVMGRALSRSVTVPVGTAVALAEKVAAGDLTSVVTVDSTDEVGQLLAALQRMNQNLIAIVSEVRYSAEAISTGSKEVANGSTDLSQRTEEQAANLEETAASMEQLASAVQQNATSSRQASQLAQEASVVAGEGGTVVANVVATMNDIASSAQKVTEIIQVIEGIAFQTNILSLNAAVEAARAGDQGRGFAVVATEVRALAHRSAEAAKEIKGLIGESVDRVAHGSALVETAGATMQKIVSQVAHVNTLIAEISSSSAEQTSGIGQVSDAVQQLDQVTQQNAALVEESAAAADGLNHLAGRLSQAVSSFHLPVRPDVGAYGDAFSQVQKRTVHLALPTR